MTEVRTIKCTHVVARVSLGFYDAEGNLVREEAFPQSGDRAVTAALFHPHPEQLASLIETCIEQAWAKVAAQKADSDALPGWHQAVTGRPEWDEDSKESPAGKERR